MTQTFIDTKSLQVIVTLTIALCVVGIIAVYNAVRYHHIKYSDLDKEKHQANSAERMAIITGVLFLLAFIIIVVIIAVNLNKSSCMDVDREITRTEVGTAKDLAELFNQ
jgi:L-asparagine transporter-like permease